MSGDVCECCGETSEGRKKVEQMIRFYVCNVCHKLWQQFSTAKKCVYCKSADISQQN
jgi:hypothetical protein